MLRKAPLYFRTIRRMKPSMVTTRLLGKRRLSKHVFIGEHFIHMPHISISELDCDPLYITRFDTEALLDGEFMLINERHKVDLDAWIVSEASHLWNFNLHYFEWGVALAVRWRNTGNTCYLNCYKEFIRSWMRACPYPEGDAWHPYTISLRLVNWLVAADLFEGALEDDVDFFAEMRESMYCQYRHLLANQEMHLRANHWWENLKTLVIMSVAFGEHDVAMRVMRRLGDQLDEQILPDGVHFERSLMYHKLVLEGMLRLWIASNQFGFALPNSFGSKAKLMLDAMASLERGMGKTPFFNDSADGVAKECRSLIFACKRLLGMVADDSKTKFPDAGYYKLYDRDVAVMFDAGELGPSYMLGHAHCDCLSFEISYRGKPVIANSGTYAYQSGLRSYFRSTAAHNTCTANGEGQLECWGEHRVGRGYRSPMIESISDNGLIGVMTLPSGICLRRTIALSEGSCVSVKDVVESDVNLEIESFVHIVPQAFAFVEAEMGSIQVSESSYSPEFGLLETSKTYTIKAFGTNSYHLFLEDEGGGDFCGE